MSNTILEKIKKLLDKSQSTDSKEEADAFMVKAQKLIQEHNVGIEYIENIDYEKDKIQEVKLDWNDKWEADLFYIIAENNLCSSFKLHGQSKSAIVGKKANIEICIYMYHFYKNAILNLSVKEYDNYLKEKKEFMKQNGVDVDLLPDELIKKSIGDKFILDFTDGCVTGISIKFKEGKREFQEQLKSQNNKTGMELILANDKEIEEYIDKNYGKLRSVSSRRKLKNPNAYYTGIERGKGINYNAGVGNSNYKGYLK